MKSRDRCHEHIQGDRCRREISHAPKFHAANFHIWGSATNGKVLRFKETDVPRIMRRLERNC